MNCARYTCVLIAVVVSVGCMDVEGGNAVGYNPPTRTDSLEEPVPQRLSLTALGLYTYPNPLSQVPNGAFTVADNVVIRRDGIAETRRGFKPATGSFGTSGQRLSSMSDFIGTLVGHTTGDKVVRYSGGAFAEYAGTYEAPEGRRMRFLQSAKSLYFTTSEGVKRVDEVTGNVFDAGVPQATGGSAALTGSTGFLPAGSQTAYRFVWGIRNANDRVILGAPSGRVTLTNPTTTGASRNVALTVSIPSWVTTSHFLQVYRADTSALETVPAGDDMNLAYETYPNQAQIDARTLTFTDVASDELKGAALYSSPNAGVPGSEKFQPPVCTDLADYKGRTWCSATIQRQRLLLTLLSVDATSGGMADGDAIRLMAANGAVEVYTAGASESGSTFQRFTSGTASQNVENTVRSLVSVINNVSSAYTAFYISGEFDSPGQLSIESVALGVDDFEITALRNAAPWAPAMPAFLPASAVSRSGSTVTVTVPSTAGLRVGDPLLLSEAFSYSNQTDTDNFPPGSYTVASITSGTQFTYTSAGPATSALDTISYQVNTPSLSSDPTDAPNGIAYSEFGEPDAVPLGNYLEAGAANYAIQRIMPLGDTLFILKEEGVYILTGDSPETFSIRAFPTPAKVVAPDSVAVLGNAIYALTDQGVMAFTESGAQLVSRPIEGTLATLYAGDPALAATTASVAFAVPYETEREYHLFLPSTSSDTYATQVYVYNYVTRSWVRWTLSATAGHVLPTQGVEMLGAPTTNGALVERKTRTLSDYQDADGVAINARVDWAVAFGDNPSQYTHWQKCSVFFESDAPSVITMGMQTELNASMVSGQFSTSGLPYITSYVPVNQSRSQRFTLSASGGQVGKRMSLTGSAIDYFSSTSTLRR